MATASAENLAEFRSMAGVAMALLAGLCPKLGFLDVPILLDSPFQIERKMDAEGKMFYMELTNESRHFGISAQRSFSRSGKYVEDHFFFNQTIGSAQPIVLKMGATLRNGVFHSFKDVPALRFKCNKPKIAIKLYFKEGSPTQTPGDAELEREMSAMSFDGKPRSADFGDKGRGNAAGDDDDDDEADSGSESGGEGVPDLDDLSSIANIESQGSLGADSQQLRDYVPPPISPSYMGANPTREEMEENSDDAMDVDNVAPFRGEEDDDVPDPEIISSKAAKRKRVEVDDKIAGIDDDDEDGEPASKRAKFIPTGGGGVKMSEITERPAASSSSSDWYSPAGSDEGGQAYSDMANNYDDDMGADYEPAQPGDEDDDGAVSAPVIVSHSLYRTPTTVSLRLTQNTSIEELSTGIAEFIRGVDLNAVGNATFTITLEKGERRPTQIINAVVHSAATKMAGDVRKPDTATLQWDTREGAEASGDFSVVNVESRTAKYSPEPPELLVMFLKYEDNRISDGALERLCNTDFFSQAFRASPHTKSEVQRFMQDTEADAKQREKYKRAGLSPIPNDSLRLDPRMLPIPGESISMTYSPTMGYFLEAKEPIKPRKVILVEDAVVHIVAEEFRHCACDYCGVIYGPDADITVPKPKGRKERKARVTGEEQEVGAPNNGDHPEAQEVPDRPIGSYRAMVFDPNTETMVYNPINMLPSNADHVICECGRVIFCTGCLAKGRIYHQFECDMFKRNRLESFANDEIINLLTYAIRKNGPVRQNCVEVLVRMMRTLIRVATVHVLELPTSRVLQTLQQSFNRYESSTTVNHGTRDLAVHMARAAYLMFEGIDLGGKPAVGIAELRRWHAQITENIFGSDSVKPKENSETSFHQHGAMIHGLSAFFNHSCEPNASWKYSYKRGQLPRIVISAKSKDREIQAGEAITISYNPEKSVLNRRISLLAWYRFECWCPRCRREMNKLPIKVKLPLVKKAEQTIFKAKKLLTTATQLPDDDDEDGAYPGASDDEDDGAKRTVAKKKRAPAKPKINKAALVMEAAAQEKQVQGIFLDLADLDEMQDRLDDKIDMLQMPQNLGNVFQVPAPMAETAPIRRVKETTTSNTIRTQMSALISALDRVTYEDYSNSGPLASAVRKILKNVRDLYDTLLKDNSMKAMLTFPKGKISESDLTARVNALRSFCEECLERADDPDMFNL